MPAIEPPVLDTKTIEEIPRPSLPGAPLPPPLPPLPEPPNGSKNAIYITSYIIK
jgi:hypothetical protein